MQRLSILCRFAILLISITALTTVVNAASYTTKILETPDGFTRPSARAINALGQIAGSAQDSFGNYHAFLWDTDGNVRELMTPTGYISSGIHDMNALGQCVGYAGDASDNGHAVVWDANGNPTDLGALDGIYSIARSINIHGQIAGFSGTSDGSLHAVMWDVEGNITDLAQVAVGWSWSRASGINDSGQVGGACDINGQSAFLLTGTQVTDLGIFAGQGPSEVYALNNQGDAIGWCASGRLVLWQANGDVVDLDVLGIGQSCAWSINDASQIVGWSSLGLEMFPIHHAVLWDTSGAVMDLNPAGMTSSTAYDINSSGWIVGSCSTGITSYAVAWIPVPEPSACIALMFGCGMLFFRRRI